MFGNVNPKGPRRDSSFIKPPPSTNKPPVQKGVSGSSKISAQKDSFEGLFDKSLFEHSVSSQKKSSNDLFAFDKEDDLFSTPRKTSNKKSNDLFGSSDEDLFSTIGKSKKSTKASGLFDSSPDDDLFTATTPKKKTSPQAESLFLDDDDDLFAPTQKPTNKTSSKKAASLDFLMAEEEVVTDSDSLFGLSFSSKDDDNIQKPLDKPTPRPELTPNIQSAVANPPKLIDETNDSYLDRTNPPGTWPNLSDLKRIENTDPPRFLDPATGKVYTQTSYETDEEALNEYGAEQLYRNTGGQLPGAKLYRTPSGYIKLTEAIETRPLGDVLKNASDVEKIALMGKVKQQFAIDALLGCMSLDISAFGVDNDGNLIRLEIPRPFSGDSDYPMEFWSMRNPAQNAGAAGLFGSLSIYDIASQIESLHENAEELINLAPPHQRAQFAERLSQMRDISNQALHMQHDRFKASYTDEMQMHRMGLRQAGISAQMPKELNQDPGNYIVTDENGVEFDNLRRKEGDPPNTPTIPYQIAQYMIENGGDPDDIDKWTAYQGINSWSDGAQGVKYFFATQKDIPLDEYYWHDGQAKAESCYKKCAGGDPEKFGKSLAMWHAANQELLANAQFRFNDREAGVVRVTRTESNATLDRNGIKKTGTYPRYKMGPNESGSIFTSVQAYAYKSESGGAVTTQLVPHHAVTACYLLGAPPDKIGSPFINDAENEFLFMPQGIDVTYIYARDHDTVGSPTESPLR